MLAPTDRPDRSLTCDGAEHAAASPMVIVSLSPIPPWAERECVHTLGVPYFLRALGEARVTCAAPTASTITILTATLQRRSTSDDP